MPDRPVFTRAKKKTPRLVITIFKCTSSHTLLNGCSSGDPFILICRHNIYIYIYIYIYISNCSVLVDCISLEFFYKTCTAEWSTSEKVLLIIDIHLLL